GGDDSRHRGLWRCRWIDVEKPFNANSGLPACHFIWTHSCFRMARVRVQSTRVFYGVCGVSWLARRRSHHTAVSVSRAGAFLVVRRLGGDQPCLSGQRSTLAFVTGAFLAPALPALFSADALSLIGITVHSDVPASVDSWLRGAAAILAIV